MRKLSLAKSFAVGAAMLLGLSSNASAQSSTEFGVANHVALGVGVGTEGIGIDAAVPFTKYLQARVGVNFIPKINVNTTADVSGTVDGQSFDGQMDIKGKFSRTTFDVKLDCYPLGASNAFFVTAGVVFGGSDLLSISGHSDDLAQKVQQAGELGIEIGDYQIPVDKNGDVSGGVRVNKVRPYVGLGYGRLVPKKRVGARIEIGAQFQGTPKVYADGVGDLTKVVGQDTDDDISKLMDWLKVYPVLKLSLRTRIL